MAEARERQESMYDQLDDKTCEFCKSQKATHVLLGLTTIHVCKACFNDHPEPPRPAPRYYLATGEGGKLNEVSYTVWRRNETSEGR